MNRIIYILLIIITMTQTLSCQNKTVTSENHFSIEKKQIYYNGTKIYLGMPMEEFTKVINSEYRITKYSIPGNKTTYYYWISKKLHLSVSDNFLVLNTLAIDNATGDYYGS
jgi:uncharacterized protein YxeA